MAKSAPRRTAIPDRPAAQRQPSATANEPFPVHLPDPPRKRAWLLALGITLLVAWLLTLAAMAIMARQNRTKTTTLESHHLGFEAALGT